MNAETKDFNGMISEVETRILSGGKILRPEAEILLGIPEDHFVRLASAADRIRIHFRGRQFDACSLINARSGLCSEDCAFCAQSAKHGSTCETYGLRSTDEILSSARSAYLSGASRFCTVTSGGALSQRDFDSLTVSLALVRKEVPIALDASLGFLDDDRAEKLRRTGVSRYNHNLETSREYYPRICTTHTFEQRVQTVRKVLSHGFSACSGGILGLGETPSQRLDMAFTLRKLGVDCVPVNILNPRPGTPLEGMIPPQPLEIMKTVALYRLILPRSTIKIAGGRETNLGDFQGMALRAGANGMIIGGYLTTRGRALEDDIRMITQAGFELKGSS